MSAEDNNSLEYDLVVTLSTLSDDWCRTVSNKVSLEAIVSILETDLRLNEEPNAGLNQLRVWS